MLTTYPNTSRLLDTIMFADDANHKDIMVGWLEISYL